MNVNNSYYNLYNPAPSSENAKSESLFSIITNAIWNPLHNQNGPRYIPNVNLINIRQPDVNGNNPLINAIKDNPAFAKSLIDLGADINYINPKFTLKLKNHDDVRIPITALSTAIIEGNEEIALLLINKGAFLSSTQSNHLNSLELAIICKKGDIAVAIINAKRDINLNDISENRKSYLEWATEHNHPEVLKALINAGADPYLDSCQQTLFCSLFPNPNNLVMTTILADLNAINYTRDSLGRSLIEVLKSIRPVNYPKLKNIIYQKLPKLKLLEKEISMRKKLAHLWEIDKKSSLPNPITENASITFDLLGNHSRRFSSIMTKSLQRFSNDFPGYIDQRDVNSLSDAIKLASNRYSCTSQTFYDQIMDECPTIIFGGPNDHSVTFLFHGECFLICDRQCNQDPFRVYYYDQDKLTPSLIEELLNDQQSNHLFARGLETFLQEISAKTTFLDAVFKHHRLIESQTSDNCSFASFEGIILAYFLLQELSINDEKLNEMEDDAYYEAFANLISKQVIGFKLFAAYLRTDYLEKYLQYHLKEPRKHPPDLELIEEIISKPLDTSTDQDLINPIQQRFNIVCDYYKKIFKGLS